MLKGFFLGVLFLFYSKLILSLGINSSNSQYHLKDARDDKCYALILSSGANRGPWQAGVVRGIAQKYIDSNKKLRWDLVGGTSVGAINGLVSQFYVAGDEITWTTEAVVMWKYTRQKNISSCKFPLKKNYGRWFLQFTKSMFYPNKPFKYLCDNAPARRHLRELFLNRKHRQRLYFTNTMRYTDKTAHIFTEQLELDELIEAVVGSGTIPGIFPIKYLRDLGYHVDGGFAAEGDLETAIKRCIAVGKANSPKDVVIDFIVAQRHNPEKSELENNHSNKDPSNMPFYSVLFESFGILTAMVSSKAIIRNIMNKYPDVVIRYLVYPSEEALVWIPNTIVDFSEWRRMHRSIEIGYNNGYNVRPLTWDIWKHYLENPKLYMHPPDPIDVTEILNDYFKQCEARKLASGFEPIGNNDVSTFILANNVKIAVKNIFNNKSYKRIFVTNDALIFSSFMGPIFIVRRCFELMQYFATARGVKFNHYNKFNNWITQICGEISDSISALNRNTNTDTSLIIEDYKPINPDLDNFDYHNEDLNHVKDLGYKNNINRGNLTGVLKWGGSKKSEFTAIGPVVEAAIEKLESINPNKYYDQINGNNSRNSKYVDIFKGELQENNQVIKPNIFNFNSDDNNSNYSYERNIQEQMDLNLISKDLRYFIYGINNKFTRPSIITGITNVGNILNKIDDCLLELEFKLDEILNVNPESKYFKFISKHTRQNNKTILFLNTIFKASKNIHDNVNNLKDLSRNMNNYYKEIENVKLEAMNMLQNVNIEESSGRFLAEFKHLYSLTVIYKHYIELINSNHFKNEDVDRLMIDFKYSFELLNKLLASTESQSNNIYKLLGRDGFKIWSDIIFKCKNLR